MDRKTTFFSVSSSAYPKIMRLGLDVTMKTTKNMGRLKFKSSVIRQKGQSQNGCYKKTKLTKFSNKETFLTPWYEM